MSATGGTAGHRVERWRIWVFAVCTLVLVGVAFGYGVYSTRGHASAAASKTGADAAKTLPLSAPGAPRVLYVDTKIGPDQGRLAEVARADPGAAPEFGAPDCDRSYSAGGTLVCLNLTGSMLTTSLHVEVYDSGAPTAHPVRSLTLTTGTPSRARVSADGKLVAWTEFVSGDSYNGPNFSTRTGILNVRTGALVENLETFNAYVDGQLYRAVDINYWGVTFAADDNTFYATMGSKGKTWLMRGDLATHELTSVVENAECPSLSPDGTRVVFKKRIGSNAAPWRFYVLDLATDQETPLAETRSVDDQAAWLDNDTVMYAVPHTDGTGYDIWDVPADGTGKPKLLIPNGSSPSVIN